MASLAQLDLWLSAARTLRHVQELRCRRYSGRFPGAHWEELQRLGTVEERLERAVRRRERLEHRGASWAEARRPGDEGLDR